MDGNRRSCEEALTSAEAQLGRVGGDDLAAECYSINEFDRLAGSCYLFLGLPATAQPILERASSSLAGKKSNAIALGNLTLAFIRQRKLDEAAATMHRTIDAVERVRSGGGLNLAFSAGQEFRPWRDEVWAQEILDRLLALMTA